MKTNWITMDRISERYKQKASSFKEIIKGPAQTGQFRYRDLFFFWHYVRPFRRLGLATLVVALFSTLCAMLIPLSGKALIDYVVLRKGFDSMQHFLEGIGLGIFIPAAVRVVGSVDLLILSLLVTGAAAGLAGVVQRYMVVRFQQGVTFTLQTALFNRLLRYPVSFFRERQTGYLMSRVIDDVDLLQYLVSSYLPSMMTSIFRLVFGVAMLFLLNVRLALSSLILLPVYIWINYFFAGRLMHASIEQREKAAEVSEGMQEVISGIETVKSFTAEEKEGRRIAERIFSALQGRMKSTLLSLLSDSSSRGIQFLITLTVMWLGAHEMLRGGMSVGDYVAFTSYMVYISGPANTLSLFHVMLQPVFASLKRVREIMEASEEETTAQETGRRSDKVVFRGEIVCDCVTFGYERHRPVLRDVSFCVNPGQIIGLSGPSGAGKSTLMSLILKFYEPLSGSIRIDGRELRDLPAGLIRERMAIVSQETFLFNDTIDRNIRYGRQDASFQEVVEAARLSDIHQDIEGLPGGYQTVVGERGIKLSAGQRQRISIARAFLKNPDILILDEPTSDLDEHAEEIVLQSLKKLSSGRTTLLASHRISTLGIADSILILEGGKLREGEGSRGTP